MCANQGDVLLPLSTLKRTDAQKDGALLRRLMDIAIYDYFSSWFS